MAAVLSYAFNIEQIDPDTERPSENIITNMDGVEMPFGDGVGDSDGDYSEPSSPPVPSSTPSTQSTPQSSQTQTPTTQTSTSTPRPTTREELGRMSREDLFRLAFGRAAPERPRNLIYNLIVDGTPFGAAEAVYSEDFSSFDFISGAFTEYLDAVLLPEHRGGAGDSTGYFTSSVLQAAGYLVADNERVYELRVTVPAEIKALSRLNLKGGHVWRPLGEFVAPAFFSFYVNYTLVVAGYYSRNSYDLFGEAYRHEELARSPANLGLDGAASMFKWALEWSAYVSEPAAGAPFTWENFRRGDVRLVREFADHHTRLTLGDVTLVSLGGAVGGARLEYNKSLFGNNPQDDESAIEFFMPKSGQVEVFMDGVFEQRFYLPAGRHEVRGFGGDVGRNRVRLVLRMEDGSVEEIPFEYILSGPRNIARGDSRLALTGGVRRVAAPAPQTFDYVADEPAVSYDYLYGLTRSVSVGVVGASSKYNSAAHGQTAVGFGRWGAMSVTGGASYMHSGECPPGARIDANFTPDTRLGIHALNRRISGNVDGRGPVPYLGLSFRGYYQSAHYNSDLFDVAARRNAAAGGVSGNLSFGLFRGSVSPGGGIDFFRRVEANEENYYPYGYNYYVRVGQTLWRQPISVSVGVRSTGGVRVRTVEPFFSLSFGHGFGIGAGINERFGRHQLSVTADIRSGLGFDPLVLRPIYYPDSVLADPDFNGPYYEVVTDDSVRINMTGGARANWQWSKGGGGIGAQSYSAGVSVSDIFNPYIPGFNASMGHTYNRASLSAGYNFTNRETSFMSAHSQSLSASLSGSFMFADGLWAFGRTTSGSFLLADARHDLKGANVHMDRSDFHRQDFSRSGWLGAAYKNHLSSHSPSPFALTLTDAPLGAVLEENRFYTVSGYKQGHALRIGKKPSVMVQARFVCEGKPVTHTYVTVLLDGGKDEDRRATFTGRDGVMQMSGLTPGKTYRIRFSARANIKDAYITIPQNAGLIYEMPDVEVDRSVSE